MSTSRGQIQKIALVIVILAIVGGFGYLFWIRTPPKIGVIDVDGSIEGFKYARLADKARKDSTIKAVVLRINSPGGTVTGTFQAESSISKLRENKPVVADLEEYATSGAYLVASAADYIYAHRQTVTAGLGVIAVWVSYEEYFENKGIDYFVWKTSEEKDLFAPWRKPTEEENEFMQELVENFERNLYLRIKLNRPQAVDYLDNIKDGSIVYGSEALKLRLVDNIGTYDDAVKKAADMVGLEEGQYNKVDLSEYYKEKK